MKTQTRRSFFRGIVSTIAAVAVAQKVVGSWVKDAFDPKEYKGRWVMMLKEEPWTVSEFKGAVLLPDNSIVVAMANEHPRHYELRDGKFVRV